MTPHIIKRYENRKLYDTEARKYVSLPELAELVRKGETIQVLDNVSGDDLTNATLTQIILDEGKKGNSLIPTDLLHDLVRRGASVLEESVSHIRTNVDTLLNTSLHQLNAWLPTPKEKTELEELRTHLKQLEETVAKLVSQTDLPAAEVQKKPSNS
ncbi:MAG: polyhydroxyalkanoate synthesis regulator DNA-binding domain-containing protein [Bacteroidetes Order II. Incertae sedis bacterium]|nr:polyhydroxyalkanoate synthesis regulator DNA-binding domain-containing protein [Bacteroidetes Order II. bacterium]